MVKKIRQEWNSKVGVPMNEKPTLIHLDSAMLMFHLLNEELLEYRNAVQSNDLIEIADALGDIQYLLNGTVNQFGLHNHFDKIQEEIHRSNMTKLVDGKLHMREDGKVLKPSTYEKPDLTFIKE